MHAADDKIEQVCRLICVWSISIKDPFYWKQLYMIFLARKEEKYKYKQFRQ